MEKKTKKLRNSGDMFLTQLFETNCMLDLEDLDQIRTRYNAGFYVLGAQFVWRKFRLLVKEFVTTNVKPELINYLTFNTVSSRPSPFAVYDFEILYLFGVITKKQKLELVRVLKNSQQFEDPFYQMSQSAFENLLTLCFETFFSKDKEELIHKYYSTKEVITHTNIGENEEFIKFLSTKNYRFYTTGIRELLYCYEKDKNNKTIENNLTFLIGHYWSKMTYNDKLFLNYLTTTNSKPQHIKAFASHALSQGETFTFDSEDKNIDDIVTVLQSTKCAYYGYKGNGLLLDCLNSLSKISVPLKYSSMYVSVLFLSAFGCDGEQMDMQSSMVRLMLDKVDAKMYNYYFNYCMRYDEDVLLMLSTNKYARTLFGEFIRSLDPQIIVTSDKQIEKILLAAITGDQKVVAAKSKELL